MKLQIKNLSHVIVERLYIIYEQLRTANVAIVFTHGHRNGLFALGYFFRIIITLIDDIINANNVPILHISATIWIGVNPLISATAQPTMIVIRCGEA